MGKSKQSYKYDAALSFAGEDRRHAKALAEKLKAEGVRVFYDEDARAHLWGKGQEVFEQIYGPESRFVVAFISKHYLKKDWSRFEFDTAKREQRQRPSEFLLPVRLDGSRMLGLPDDRCYLSLSDLTIDQVAAEFMRKFAEATAADAAPSAATRATVAKRKAAILSAATRRALGMIVASRLALPLELYQRLFPDTDWKAQSRILERYGLITTADGLLVASREAIRAMSSDEEDAKPYSSAWISKLESLKQHCDIALYLSAHYLNAGRWDEAALLLANFANGGLHGHWNVAFLDFLLLLSGEKPRKKLAPGTRLQVDHAVAIGLVDGGAPSQAIPWFERVRRDSLKLKDNYWLGQYYINSGIAHDRCGDTARALAAYQHAIAHGEKTGDKTLLSRALGNLAMLKTAEREPEAALALLDQSIASKRSEPDEFGLAIAEAQRGTLQATRGKYQAALQHLLRAEKAFAQFDAPYDLAKTYHNLGNVYFSLSQNRKAISAYRRAPRLAKADGFADLRLLATRGLAQALQLIGHFDKLERLCRELLDLPEAAEAEEARIIGHYGIGMADKCRNQNEAARDHLGRALRLARKTGHERWMTAALIALASEPNSESQLEPDPKRLAKLAAAEEKRANWNVAAELWGAAIGPLTRAALVEAASDAFSSAERCLKQAGSEPPDMIELHLKRYSWCRQVGLHSEALNALEAAERLAAQHKLPGEQARAIDEQGVCYHWLGQSGKAVACLQKAVNMARQHRLQAQLQRSLNNLGEALRVHGRLQEAVDAFEESEDLCRASGDAEGAIATALNRVLALEDIPAMPQAAALLKRCCSEAKKGEHWREYARALESLGNFAWRQGWLKLARTHYSEALAVARRHGLQERVPEIVVNYASLLQSLGQAGRGLRLLEPLEGCFSQQREPSIYYDVLADLLAETGHTERAKRCLQSGKESAAAPEQP